MCIRDSSETGSSSYESYTGSSSASDSADESALSADEDSNFGSDDIPASAYAGAAGAVTAGATVAEPHSGELDYNGPELAHSAELDYQGADDDLPELLPREAAQAPAPQDIAELAVRVPPLALPGARKTKLSSAVSTPIVVRNGASFSIFRGSQELTTLKNIFPKNHGERPRHEALEAAS